MTTLLNHIKELNAQTLAWVNESPETRWSTIITEDMAYWEECGIVTVEDFERNELISFISDESKSLYGRRSRLDFDNMSIEELEAEADSLAKSISIEIDEEQERESRILAAFEASINEAIELGANTRSDAIRWILDANNLLNESDPSYICYNLGLPYKMANEFNEFLITPDGNIIDEV